MFSVLELTNGQVPNFYTSFLPSRASTAHKNQAVKFPTSFLLDVDCIRRVPTEVCWGVEGGRKVGKIMVLIFQRERWRDVLGQVMGFKLTGWNEGKSLADVFIKHYRVMQPLTAIHRLAKLSFGSHAPRMHCYCATEKQPAKVDHLSVACFKCEI